MDDVSRGAEALAIRCVGPPEARFDPSFETERYEIYEGCTCAHDHCARWGGAADDHRTEAEPTKRRKIRPRTTTAEDDATSSEATEEEAEGERDVKKSKRQRRQTSDSCACLARMGGRAAYDPSSHRLLPGYFPELERDATHEREDVGKQAQDPDAATTATTPTTRRQPTDRPLFECHSRCGCSADCASRVVQKGITLPLEVFMSAAKGWSVRVLSPIRKGQFVSEYAGEVVSTEEAQRRWRDEYDRAGLNYLLVVREFIPARGATLRTNIDGTRLGNVSRFFNHSCDPNMTLFLVRVGSLIPRLAFFACCDVAAGEELTFDYGHGSTQAADVVPEPHAPATRQCYCGARHCRGVLPFDSLA